MIRIALRKMMLRASQAEGTGRKVPYSIQQVHEGTGIHRKILSRILNHPEQFTSSEHIEKLNLFFFKELRQPSMNVQDQKLLMKNVISELIEVYPDEVGYWQGLEDVRDSQDKYAVPIDVLWRISQGASNPQKERQSYEEHKVYEKKGQQKLLEALAEVPSKK